MARPPLARLLFLAMPALLAAAAASTAAATAVTAPQGAAAPSGGADPGADLLRLFSGVWNATMQIAAPDDSPPAILNGIEVNTPGGDGAWVVSDFRSQLEGRPFQGHAILSWNPEARRFRRVWADASSPAFWLSEGTWDADTRTLTLWIETVNSNGRPVRWREETVFKGDDTRTFTMYVPGAGTTEAAAVSIMYHRRPEGAPPQPVLPPPSPPTPEHALVLRDAGAWSAQVQDRMGPGGSVSFKGTEANTICCGGHFLVTDFQDAGAKRPFAGHGLLGYDPAKKRYVSAWVDTTDRLLEVHEGDHDAAAGTLTFRFDGPDGHGGTKPVREVLQWKGADQRILTFWIPGPDGKDAAGMTIKYRRTRDAAAPAGLPGSGR